MAKVLFFVLVGLLASQQSLDAKTLGDYEREKYEALERVHSENSKLEQVKDRLSKLKSELKSLKNQKQSLLEGYKNQVEQQGTEKVDAAKKNLKLLTELKADIQVRNKFYAKNMEPHIQAYRALVTEFKSYRAQEGAKKEQLKKGLAEGIGAQTISDWAGPRHVIDDIYVSEINTQNKISNRCKNLAQDIRQTYRDYLASIKFFEADMDRFNFPRLSPPQRTLERLNQMVEYADQRRKYFSEIITARSPDIDQRFTQITADRVQKDLDAYEKANIDLAVSDSWGNLANELLGRQIKLNIEDKAKVGCGRNMRGFYDLYQEVLTYQGRCADVQALIDQDSPYKVGCLILKPLIKDAEKFFSESAWRYMNLSLFSAKRSAPKSLSSLVKKLGDLKVHRAVGLQRPDLLLKAVKVHDQLLKEWEETESSADSSADSDDKAGSQS